MSICPFSDECRRLPSNWSSHLAKVIEHPYLWNNLIFMLWYWTSPRGFGWLPHLVIQNCPGDLKTKPFEKGTNHLRCPTVSCLFSVPCPGWFVKHVFRLIGSHIHLDPGPCPGSANPILPMCPCAPVWASPTLLIHTHTPSQSDSFLMWCTCSISNSVFSCKTAEPILCLGK